MGRVAAGRWSSALLVACCAVGPVHGADAELKWYGYFKMDLVRDSAEPGSGNGNFITYVKPHAKGDATAITNLTARQTRLGFNMTRGEAKGNLEYDFYGAGDEHKNSVQLRKAYVDVPLGRLSLRAGQDSDLISPLVPSTLNYTVCWGVGNIGYRRPQVRVYTQQGGLYAGVALVRNISTAVARKADGTTVTGDLNLDGINDADAGLPVLQGRLGWTAAAGSHKVAVGVSGHYGAMEAGARDYTTWSAGGDLVAEVNKKVKLQAEAYTGDNTATYHGAIMDPDTEDGTSSVGGWANVVCKATDKVDLSLGAGMDQVDKKDLGAASRKANSVVFGNAQYGLGSGASVGVEVARWATEYHLPAAGNATTPSDLRVQLSVQGSF